MNKASELLSQGNKSMVCGEIPKAVNLYEEAVQLLVKSCGELSRDCAEAYFSCGSALLELGRMETSVLGAALDGVKVEEERDEEANEQFEKPTECEGEERQRLRDEIDEAMADGEREKEIEGVSAKCQRSDIADLTCDKQTEMIEQVLQNGGENGGLSTAICGDVIQEQNDGGGTKETPTVVADFNKLRDKDSTTKTDRTEDGQEKQALDDSMNVEVCGGNPQCTPELAICGEELPLKEKTAAADEKETAITDQMSEAKVVNSDEGKREESSNMAAECEHAEMADEDAPDEVEEDAEEDEENTTEEKDIQEGEEIDEDKEEDVPNFQLAWEYLDLAKVIYLKSESAEDHLKAAECFIKLGELSMETEQHVTAAEDIESALKIQQKLLAADDRLVAETHCQLGLAYSLGKEFQLSIQHYTQAIGVIEVKIVSLNKLVGKAATGEDKKENAGSAQVKKYQDEIKELQELIPEMRNKIEDAQEEAKDMEKMKQIAKEALGFSGLSKKCESPTKRTERSAGDRLAEVDENGEKKATDITHLVRKKRKPDEEAQAPGEQQFKKIRQDDSTAAANEGTVNG